MWKSQLVIAAALAAMAAPALAAPIKVYAPRVEAGVLELEADAVREKDETETRLEVGYGFTSWWKATAVVEVVDGPGRGPRAEAYAIENILVGPRPGWLPFDWGVYAEYEVAARDGSPDKVEVKALFSGAVGKVETRVNLEAERETGSNASDETEFAYAVQSRYRFNDDFALGLQASGDLGSSGDFGRLSDREQLFGPIAAGEIHIPGIPGELELEAAYLAGVTDASPDDVVRVKIAWERKF
jgi:hypothetical protein